MGQRRRRRRTDVLLAGALEGDLGADDAHEDADLVAGLVDLVGGPVDAAQCGFGDHIRAALSVRAAGQVSSAAQRIV